MEYLDFEVEILPAAPSEYTVTVRSEFGEATGTMRLPFDTLALENRLQALQIALLRSATASRRVASPEETVVHGFGQELFDSLFADGPIRGRFEAARDGASERDAGIRVRLRIAPPELAALPWEYLYDPTRDDFLGLSIATPIVRYVPLPRPVRPLAVKPPIRILAMIAASAELPSLDTARERQRLEVALRELVSGGFVEITWLPGETWRDLQAALLNGPWHIFHFIGHGGFDEVRGEGFVFLSGEGGQASRLSATSLGRLLGDHDPMRLIILNSCEGARGDNYDVFSSTAAVLVKRGTPGVIAMQYPITDRAAIEFSRSIYGAIAAGEPIDTALAVARKSISFEIPGTLEWGTPALYLRAPDGVLFVMPQLDADARRALDAATTLQPSTVPSQAVAEAPDFVMVSGSSSSPTAPDSAPATPPPAALSIPIQSPDVSVASPTDASPQAQTRNPEGEPRVSAAAAAMHSGAGATRRLLGKGWQTGHTQTLIGAELGAIAAMSLNLQYVLGQVFLSVQPSALYELAYALIWIAAIAGASIVLGLAGPPRWWRIVLALVLLFPLFRGFANNAAIYMSPSNLLYSVVVVGILALVASSVVLVRRPQPR